MRTATRTDEDPSLSPSSSGLAAAPPNSPLPSFPSSFPSEAAGGGGGGEGPARGPPRRPARFLPSSRRRGGATDGHPDLLLASIIMNRRFFQTLQGRGTGITKTPTEGTDNYSMHTSSYSNSSMHNMHNTTLGV